VWSAAGAGAAILHRLRARHRGERRAPASGTVGTSGRPIGGITAGQLGRVTPHAGQLGRVTPHAGQPGRVTPHAGQPGRVTPHAGQPRRVTPQLACGTGQVACIGDGG
jgi:hypothetical protein